MEVAIRRQLDLRLSILSRCSSIEQGFWHKFLYMLYIHGHQIMNNLETRRNKYGFFVNNNHFMANLCGLIFLGLLFQGNDSGKQWLRFGLRHLAKEIKRQVTVDGCDFESSISYHRLVLEMVSYTLILLKINGFSFPDRIWKRLRAMLEFVVSYVNEKGMAPPDWRHRRWQIPYIWKVFNMESPRPLLSFRFGTVFVWWKEYHKKKALLGNP